MPKNAVVRLPRVLRRRDEEEDDQVVPVPIQVPVLPVLNEVTKKRQRTKFNYAAFESTDEKKIGKEHLIFRKCKACGMLIQELPNKSSSGFIAHFKKCPENIKANGTAFDYILDIEITETIKWEDNKFFVNKPKMFLAKLKKMWVEGNLMTVDGIRVVEDVEVVNTPVEEMVAVVNKYHLKDVNLRRRRQLEAAEEMQNVPETNPDSGVSSGGSREPSF